MGFQPFQSGSRRLRVALQAQQIERVLAVNFFHLAGVLDVLVRNKGNFFLQRWRQFRAARRIVKRDDV